MILGTTLRILRATLAELKIYRPLLRYLNNIKTRRFKAARRITFIVYQSAVWKSSGVYKALEANPDVDVSITIMPIIDNGIMLVDDWLRTTKYFQDKGYNVDTTLSDLKTSRLTEYFSDIDTVVFSDCWNLSQSNFYYYVLFFKDCVYVPYSHQVSQYGNFQAQYNQLLHNFVRSIYAPHQYERDIFEVHSHIKNDNVKSLGYPGVSHFIEACDSDDGGVVVFPNDPWLSFVNKSAKRLIWAPHHSINWTERRYSNFIEMHEKMLDYVDLYKSEINFIFKPHPMLKQILYNNWGIEKTDEYYKRWQGKSNCKVEEGEYGALFFYSDALIHDCGSFVAEYIYLDKVHAFVHSSENIYKSFNYFGQQCLRSAIKIMTDKDLEDFIRNFSIKGLIQEKYSKTEYIDELKSRSRNCDTTIAQDILNGS